jgi:hypothetical protein
MAGNCVSGRGGHAASGLKGESADATSGPFLAVQLFCGGVNYFGNSSYFFCNFAALLIN